jgi:uncharacterized Zn-binding protein involved in type VI secretion
MAAPATAGRTANALNKAAEATSHPGAIAGRGAQTGNAERAADPQHSATDVWTRSWDGAVNNMRNGNPSQLLGAMGPIPKAGLGAAVFQGAMSLPGVGRGLADFVTGLPGRIADLPQTVSGIVTGVGQQAGSVKDAVANLFHQGDGPAPDGVLGHFGAVVNSLTNVEQLFSMAFSAIPFPALPAVRVGDLDVGLPHGHLHPPNLIPPAPTPIPLPSTGPVLPIPYVSGAATVLINGMPAARCGDMGAGVWCGGFFPLFEIFLGSSSVWLEGARAARVGPITKHCIFSNPKAIVKGGDSPIGPPVGFPVGSSPNVLIGGFPLPSLTAMALGKMFKGLFKGIGWLAGKAAKKIAGTAAFSRLAQTGLGQKAKALADDIGRMRKPGQGNINLLIDYIRARRLVNKLLTSKKLQILDYGDAWFREWARRDIEKFASSKVGRKVLEDIHSSPRKVIVEPITAPGVDPDHFASGPHAIGTDDFGAHRPGVGSNARVRLDPDYPFTDQMPSDRVAGHELGHARNIAQGNLADEAPTPAGFDKDRWTNLEEYNNIRDVDNPYGQEWGLDPRTGHNDFPGTPVDPPSRPPGDTIPDMTAADAADTIPGRPRPGGTPSGGPDPDAADTIPGRRRP